MDYNDYINVVEDFPIKGIKYKDIQPLLADPQAFEDAIHAMVDLIDVPLDEIDYVVGIESRGFIFATALAWITNSGLRIVRKKGKLPNRQKFSKPYGLEYGKDELEIGYIPQHDLGNCIVVDDVLATGGTIEAASELCEMVGLNVVDKLCLLDVGIYKGKEHIKCLIK
jgi:adenine phosphoribosyltransferase